MLFGLNCSCQVRVELFAFYKLCAVDSQVSRLLASLQIVGCVEWKLYIMLLCFLFYEMVTPYSSGILVVSNISRKMIHYEEEAFDWTQKSCSRESLTSPHTSFDSYFYAFNFQ